MMKKSLLLFLAIFLLVFSCQKKIKDHDTSFWIKFISCDFEDYTKTNSVITFKTDSSSISIQSTGKVNTLNSKSKNNSLEITNQHNTPILSLTELKVGQLVEFTIWHKSTDSNAFVYIKSNQINGTETIQRSNLNKIVKSKKGWKQHFISTPIFDSLRALEFYIGTTGSKVSFDDLKIRIYPAIKKNKITKSLNLYIPGKSKNKLNNYINKALNKKVIPTSSKKYVKAFYLNNNDSIQIELKIKGDWTDHIKPYKASYRLKLGSEHSFEGMNSFSIQHPRTRNYLSEWIMHAIAEQDDILTTHYDFINVTINDYFYGVYAIEEHFDKHILENRGRREGPILKQNETGVWQYHKAVHDKSFSKDIPFFEAAYIDAFKVNRILKNITLKKQFLEGQKLLQLFINGHIDINDLFDIDLLAKFYVLVELSSNYHALTWHNRRYYFNPVTNKLENIFFDAIPYFNNNESIIKNILINTEKEPNLILDNALLMNREFKDRYFFYLNQKLKDSLTDSIFNKLDDRFSIYLNAIKGESSNYVFEKNSLNKRLQFLQSNLEEINRIWENKLKEAENIKHWMKPIKYEAHKDSTLFKSIALNAYIQKTENNKHHILLENYHLNPIKIQSVKYRKKGVTYKLKETIHLSEFNGITNNQNLVLDTLPYKIYYTTSNTKAKIFSAKILPWKKPDQSTTRMDLSKNFKTNTNLFTIKNDTLTFLKTAKLNELIYIPKQYKVQILAGSKIEIEELGGLIINNELICKGTAENPITINSRSDRSMGITILNAKKATIYHTEIIGLSNLNYNNWTLTGALTIYETKTDINFLKINNNTSEDALNIIRSHFEIKNLEITNTKSDGFDADFCTGTIDSSIFRNTGNDCIDFSGSTVKISNIDIFKSGDKGISGGEKSFLNLFNINIDGAITAIASKDASIVNGENISIRNVISGNAAFQKKSNYGVAEINLNNVRMTNCTSNTLVELGSKITLNGTSYTGKEKFNIDELYKAFSK